MRDIAGRVAVAVSVLLIGAIVYVMYAPSGGSASGGGASRQPVAPSLGGVPTGPAGADRAAPLTRQEAAPFVVRDVTVGVGADSVLVSWRPARVDGVAGFLVAVVAPDGRLIERRTVEPSRTAAVFAQPPPGVTVCATVTTVVGGGSSLRLAPGERVCPEPGRAPAPTG